MSEYLSSVELYYATSGHLWHRLPVEDGRFAARSFARCGFAPTKSWTIVEAEPIPNDNGDPPTLCERCARAIGGAS